ncbi:Ig-like domain-containing protein [Mycolicibacterium pulveris]|uniref:Ig-like domain-containing protein n=1 Tax=Mycolicibacterium pulveris TaxID=36813 RepID=UPI003CF7D154
MGALAAALGIGIAVATTPGAAWAHDNPGADAPSSQEDGGRQAASEPGPEPSVDEAQGIDAPAAELGEDQEAEPDPADETADAEILEDEVDAGEEEPAAGDDPSEVVDSAADADPDTGGTELPSEPPTDTSTPPPDELSDTDEAPVPMTDQAPDVDVDDTGYTAAASAAFTVSLAAPTVDSTSEQLTPLAAAQPTGLMALPGQMLKVVSEMLSVAMSPLLLSGPSAPADTPFLWGLLSWVRRHFLNQTPTISYTVGAPDANGNIKITLNEADQDGDRLVYSARTPAKGSLTLNADGHSFTYDPDEGATGTDTITISASDATYPHLHGLFGLFRPGGGHVTTTTITLTIPDLGPVVDPDNPFTIDDVDSEFGTVTGSVNVTDPDTEDLTYTLVELPNATAGTVNLDPTTGDWSFIPTPAARVKAFTTEEVEDVVTFAVTVSDGQSTTAPIVVTVPIDAVEVAAYPSLDGAPISGVWIGPDGRAYQIVALMDPEANTYRTALAVFDPTDTAARTTVPFDGLPSGFAFGADGTAYQTTANIDLETSTITGYAITIVRPDTTHTTVPITGTVLGQLEFGPDGSAYQTSYTAGDDDDSFETFVLRIDPVDGSAKIITVPGYPADRYFLGDKVFQITELDPFDPFEETDSAVIVSVLDFEAGAAQTAVTIDEDFEEAVTGPNGNLYVTTVSGTVNTGYQYALTVITPDGPAAPIALPGNPTGVVFGNDETAYLTGNSNDGGWVTVVDSAGTGTTKALGGGVSGPVVIGPDGTVYLVSSGALGTEVLAKVLLIRPDASSEEILTRLGFPQQLRSLSDGTAYLQVALVNEATLLVLDVTGEQPRDVVIYGSIDDVIEGPGNTLYVQSHYWPGGDAPTDSYVTVVDKATGATTLTQLPADSMIFGVSAVEFDTAGNGYVISHVYNDAAERDDAVVTVFRPAGDPVEIPIDGNAVDTVFGPGGTVYVTTRVPVGDEEPDDYLITVITDGGEHYTTVALGGPTYDGVVIGPDGTAYQVVDRTVDLTGATEIVVFRADGTVDSIMLTGYQAGPVTFGPDGVAYITTGHVDAEALTFETVVTVVAVTPSEAIQM